MKKRTVLLTGFAATMILAGAVSIHAEEEAAPLYTRLETLGHDYQLQDDSYEATDTEGGYRHYICTDCGDEYDYHTDPLVYTTNPKTGEPVTQNGAHNPILPSWEHVPDGEPQVFWSKEDNEWRVYIYGSHDWRGDGFCYTDYVTWSAPVYDMSDWRYEGIILDITDGSIYGGKILYAPDVAYDLQTDSYYQVANEAYTSIVLRVADNPAGPWDKDQAVWTISFKQAYDPTVYCENGTIYVSGACRRDEEWIMDPAVYQATLDDGYSEGSGQLAVIYQLKADPQDGDGIEAVSYMPNDEHIYNPIYEGPSLYGWCEELGAYLYLFVSNEFGADGMMYDSGIGYMWTDDLMNGTWHYGDNGIDNDVPEGVAQEQIGGHGNIISDTSARIYRDYKTGEMTFADFPTYLHANNHGSMEKINGKWYVNGHRHCGGYAFARQAVMGEITVEKKEDGTPLITPMELTSSGPADSLDAYSVWDAGCVAYLLEAADIPAPEASKELIASGPYITATWDEAATHASYITRIENGNIAGYKYINFGEEETAVALRMLVSKAEGAVDGSAKVLIDAPSEEEGGTVIGTMDLSAAALTGETEEGTDGTVWTWAESKMDSPVSGTHAVYLLFEAEGSGEICSFDQFTFVK